MTPIVSIIMGSTSDLPVMEKAAQLLNDLHVPFEMNALSAHRTPEAVEEFAKNAHFRGIKVIIAAAGMAAHLPGVIANSQFEQFYRTLKNLPLADTDAFGFSGMLNLVGEQNYSGKVKYEGLEEVLKLSKTYVHLYGKTETKPGRKMGHINVLANSREELLEKLNYIKTLVRVIA
jgi:hypothetical protein